MKAMMYREYGPPTGLQLKEVEMPVPKDDEVLIKVYASSVNSWDWDLVRGTPFIARLSSGLIRPKYTVLGADVAGRIEAVGKGIKQLKKGDEVFGDLSGDNWGCFAEYVCASEKSLALKSSDMTWEQAAAVPQAAVLALQGLRYNGPIQKGQRVLINGAGGGVGTFAIQMAKAFGAEVTAVDSTAKLGLMSALGADHVIDYTQEDFAKSELQYDLIIDMVASRSLNDCKKALSSNGAYSIIGGTTSTILQAMLCWPLISRIGKKKMGLMMYKTSKKDLEEINALFMAGKVKPVIDKCYSLEEVPEALQYFGTGKVQGKIVVRI